MKLRIENSESLREMIIWRNVIGKGNEEGE